MIDTPETSPSGSSSNCSWKDSALIEDLKDET
jgi:hypothetical protein